MQSNPIPLITICLLLAFSSQAQNDNRYDLLLQSGRITPSKNIGAEQLSQFNRTASRTAGKTFAILQFEQLPGEKERQELKEAGIELLDYIPNNAYTVTITGNLDETLLEQVKARALVELNPVQKIQPLLVSGKFPSWAVKIPGTVDVWISYLANCSL